MISAGFRLLGIACCVGAVGWPLSLSAVTAATLAQRVGGVAGAEKIAALLGLLAADNKPEST